MAITDFSFYKWFGQIPRGEKLSNLSALLQHRSAWSDTSYDQVERGQKITSVHAHFDVN